MFALPPAAVAEAPEIGTHALEASFTMARLSALRSADPGSVLADGGASVDDKLAAIDSLHSRIPFEPRAAQIKALDAIAAAASSTSQPPDVRAKALTFLGYAMPQVTDDAARTRGLKVLLAALTNPIYRIFALRGFGPACHELPKADEGAYQGALLDLLDGPVAGEERATAFVALYSFASTRDDLAKRDPALVAQLDERLLAPIEADPAGFADDPRSSPAAREMAAAVIWVSARHRQTLGNPAPAARAHAVLVKLAAVETDATARGWIQSYRDAPPPRPDALTESTTRRAPSDREE
jgi:hypothetical protein